MRLLLVVGLACAAVAACKFDPKIDAKGFRCTTDADCPGGYTCVSATDNARICCNGPDPAACLTPIGGGGMLGNGGGTGATASGGVGGGDAPALDGGRSTDAPMSRDTTMAPDAPGTGGALGAGGISGSGGLSGTAGATAGTGGVSTTGSGGAGKPDGGAGAGGALGSGGSASLATGGRPGSGGAGRGGATGSGGAVNSGGAVSSGGVVGTGGAVGSGGTSTGTCVASKAAGVTVTGTGPHSVTVETNAGAGINKGTIYRPSDLGGSEKYPIFVWGEGSCTADGTSNKAAMGEIASHGYFVIADGLPAGSGSSPQDGSTLLGYITWAIAENDTPCSAYYRSLDTNKVASDGFSCGGIMSETASADPRLTAVGVTSSGLFSADASVYSKIHTPFKILVGGSGDMAYENGKRDYEQISALGIPTIYFSKDGAGHGGDLSRGTGDFNTINLAWLNWQLKGDTGATGKGLLMGSTCKYCTATGWEFKSKNF